MNRLYFYQIGQPIRAMEQSTTHPYGQCAKKNQEFDDMEHIETKDLR